jgi:hypothetical protein
LAKEDTVETECAKQARRTMHAIEHFRACAPSGQWEVWATKHPHSYEVGPSQRQIVAILTNDGTGENRFGYLNACYLTHLHDGYPALKARIEELERELAEVGKPRQPPAPAPESHDWFPVNPDCFLHRKCP